MAGLGLAAGYGAGAMGGTLGDILKQRFLEQLQKQKLAEDIRQADMQNRVQQTQLAQGQQRIGLEGQKLGEDRRQFDVSSGQAATRLGYEGDRVRLAQAAQPVELAHVGAETNALNRQPEEAQKGREFTGGENAANRANSLTIARGHDATSLAAARDRADNTLVGVQTRDPNTGENVTQFVRKTEGAQYARPLDATSGNRLRSAKTVSDVGNDLISELSNPAFAATVGPVLGRYSSLQEFIGNPPPEYSRLAGEIESYSLANMGVHGMRSAQGAQMIQKMLTGKHTPQSLIATIQGLNKFSEQYQQNTQPNAGGPKAPPQETPAPAAKKEFDYVPGKGLVPRGGG